MNRPLNPLGAEATVIGLGPALFTHRVASASGTDVLLCSDSFGKCKELTGIIRLHRPHPRLYHEKGAVRPARPQEDAMKRFLSVGLGLFLLALPAWGQTPEIQKAVEGRSPKATRQQKATVAYLQKLQLKDGGFARISRPVEVQPAGDQRGRARAQVSSAARFPTGPPAPISSRVASTRTSGGFADAAGRQGRRERPPPSAPWPWSELKLPADLFEAGVVKYLGDNVKTFRGHSHRRGGVRGAGQAAGPGRRLAGADRQTPQ